MTNSNISNNSNVSDIFSNDDYSDINDMLNDAADYDQDYGYSQETTTSPVSSDKTETTVNNVNNINTISQEETSMTNSNISAIVNFGTVADYAVSTTSGVSLAEVFASLIYKTRAFTPFANDSAEKIAAEEARINKLNADTAAARAAFISKFEGGLGRTTTITLVYEQRGIFHKTSAAIKANLEALFTLVCVDDKNAPVKVHGLPKVEGAEQVDVSEANAPLVLFSILAAATVNLSAIQRAELLAVLFKATNNGTAVTVNGVTVDTAKATVSTVTRSLTANKASCFGAIVTGRGATATNDFVVLDAAHSVFMFALQAFSGTAKQAETAVNLAVKLFVPAHNYGHKPDADDISFFVRANLIYTNSVVASGSKFPNFSIKGGKQHPEFLSYILAKGVIATSDKTNIKFITIGEGAEATGLGWNRELGVMMTVNDVNKPSKLINRGAANNYDCAMQPNRVASNFGFLLSTGEVARTKGRMMAVAYTNSNLLTAGSGTGTIHPNTFFEYSVPKTLIFPVHFSLLGSEYINNEGAQDGFVAALYRALESKKGQIFAPGEVIASVGNVTLISNTETCANVEFLGAEIAKSVLDNNELNIAAQVKLTAKSQFVKTRRFATKFTTTPYEVKGLSRAWEIILNNECTKGQGALLEMFANETGERFVNNNTGEFVTPDGDVINLLDADNAFQAWKEASTQVEVITVTVAKSVFNNLKGFDGGEFTVVSEDATTVTVQETVSVIYGSLVFDVEISTPLESVSSSSMTFESASAVYLQSKKLGEALFNEIAGKTELFSTLAKTFANFSNDVEVIDLNTDEGYLSFMDSISDLETAAITQRQLFTSLGKAFPKGVCFLSGISKLNISFQIVESFGQFNHLNGGAAKEAAQIVNFLLDVIDNGRDNAPALITNAAKAFDSILNTAVDSKNVLKKPTRSGRLVYGKVRTALHPLLHTVDGIPSVVINANCPIVKMLGIKDGEFVGFARTPMPFLGAGRVVLTTDAGICDIAHVLLDPFVWHSLCEGDSDGDGIALINLSKGAVKISEAEANEINSSLMGIAGYEHLYGANLPFADFMSAKDKHSKKNPAAKVAMISSSIKNPDSAKQELIALTPAVLGDFAARVANHYKANVGAGYGICSKLVFHTADVAAKGDSDELTTLTEACLVAWRLLYEGLGLSGYSPEAYNVYDIINKASCDTRLQQVARIGDSIEAIFEDPSWKFDRKLCVNGAEVLSAAAPFNELSLSVEVFQAIIEARMTTRALAKLEGFGTEPGLWWSSVVPSAIKFGTLRRLSQGDDRVSELYTAEEEAELQSYGDFVAKPLTRFFQDSIVVEEAFSNQLLGNVADKLSAFHATISAAKAEMKNNI